MPELNWYGAELTERVKSVLDQPVLIETLSGVIALAELKLVMAET